MLASTIQFTNTPPNPRPETGATGPIQRSAVWPPGLNPEPKQATPGLTAGGCPFRTQQCARPPGTSPDEAVYDVSTHELRHHAFGGVTALAPTDPTTGPGRRDAP
jgi:hypothetical protein